MSSVRVLVGTRKGAFVINADGARKNWDVAGPFFGGWEIYHLKGSPADPNRIYASQGSGWFGQLIQRSDDGGKTWEPVDNKFVYDGVPGTHQWYDGTPHPWEFKRVWHLEPSLTDPDTVYAGVEDAALFRTTDGGRAGTSCPACAATAPGSQWAPGAGGLCLHTILLDPIERAAHVHRDLRGRRVSHRRWRRDVDSRSTRACAPSTSPTRRRKSATACTASRMHPSRPNVLFMQKHWDVMRSDDAGESVDGSQRQPADRLRLRDRRPRARAGHDLRRADQERLRALPARRQAARLSQPQRRQRMGAADQRTAAEGLLRQRAARRDGGRCAGFVRHLLRHDRRPGVRVGRRRATTGRRSSRDLPPVLSVEVQTLRMTPMAIESLPAHLRTLARVGDEVHRRCRGRRPRRGAVLDALEARYPVLRGTIRDHVTLQRRPFLRFFACEEDLSHEPPDVGCPTL